MFVHSWKISVQIRCALQSVRHANAEVNQHQVGCDEAELIHRARTRTIKNKEITEMKNVEQKWRVVRQIILI